MNNKEKNTRPDYAKIILVGAVIFFVIWFLLLVLFAFLGLGGMTIPVSAWLTLFLFAIYVVLDIKYHERLGAVIYTGSNIRERPGGVIKCYFCGTETTLANQYKFEKWSFGRKPKIQCPACFSKRRISNFKANLVIYGIIALAGLVMAYFMPESAAGWILLNLILVVILSSMLIVPHELAHALAGHLLGMRVHKVTIGYGKVIYSTKMLGWDFELRMFPFGGVTMLLNKSARFFRLRLFISVLAGPIMNMLIILFLFKAYPGGAFYKVDPGGGVHLTLALLLANLLSLAISLVPFRAVSSAGVIPNDGLFLLTLPFMNRQTVTLNIIAAYSYEGISHRMRKDWDAARKCSEEALAKFPGNPISTNDMAMLYLETGELEKARQILLELNARTEMDPYLVPVMKNNLAYVDALIGGADLIEEADRLSDEAMNAAPWMPFIKGTRGTVLVELGRIEDGVALLRQALDEQDDPEGKAANTCHIAIAEVRAGMLDEARRYLDMAKRYDPGSNLLKKAEDEFAKHVNQGQ